MKDLIILGKTTRCTREVPPDFQSVPYSCSQVKCPHCEMEWDIIDSSIKPGNWIICGNAECRKSVRFPYYGGKYEDGGKPCISETSFCIVKAQGE